eukprot:3828382-Amphidinium_carterae.1
MPGRGRKAEHSECPAIGCGAKRLYGEVPVGRGALDATESLRADRGIVLTAVQQDDDAPRWAADCLLGDPTFATAAKR